MREKITQQQPLMPAPINHRHTEELRRISLVLDQALGCDRAGSRRLGATRNQTAQGATGHERRAGFASLDC